MNVESARLRNDEYKWLMSFALTVYSFLEQYRLADEHNRKRQAQLESIATSGDPDDIWREVTGDGYIDLIPMWEKLYEEYLKVKGFWTSKDESTTQRKRILTIFKQMDAILPIVKANSMPIMYVMNPDPLKRHELSTEEYKRYILELKELNCQAEEYSKNRSPEATGKALRILKHIAEIFRSGEITNLTTVITCPEYDVTVQKRRIELLERKYSISLEFSEPVDCSEISIVEEKCGPLATTLKELAELVRECQFAADKNSFVQEIENIAIRAFMSARLLRPKIESVIGPEQAAKFYKEMRLSLRFSEQSCEYGEAVCWCGCSKEVEQLAKTLEHWHSNLLLLTHPEKRKTVPPAKIESPILKKFSIVIKKLEGLKQRRQKHGESHGFDDALDGIDTLSPHIKPHIHQIRCDLDELWPYILPNTDEWGKESMISAIESDDIEFLDTFIWELKRIWEMIKRQAPKSPTKLPAQIEGQDKSENKRKTYQDLLNEFETAYATYGTTDLTLFRCGEGGIPPEYLDCVGPGPRTIAGAGSGYMLVFSCSGDKKDIGDIYRKLADKAGSKLAANSTAKFGATGHVGPGDIWCAYLFKHGDHQELPDGICKLQNVFLQSIRLIRSLAESGGPEQPTQPTKKTFVEIMQDYYHYFQKALIRPDSQMRLIRIVSDDVPEKHEYYPGAEPDAVASFELGGGYWAVSESREIMYLYNEIATCIGIYLIPMLCISPETRDLSGAAIWSILLYKKFESSRFTIKGYDILTDPLLKSQQYIAQLIVDKNEQLAKEQQELQQQTPIQPATVIEAEKEQKFQPWGNSGDACFIIENDRIKFHYQDQIKDLKLKYNSHTLNLLVFLNESSLQPSEIKEKICPNTKNKASKIVDYANELLNTKIAGLGFSDIPSDVEFIRRDNFGHYFLSLKMHRKEDFERMQLEQPLVDDRKFKNLDDAEKSY